MVICQRPPRVEKQLSPRKASVALSSTIAAIRVFGSAVLFALGSPAIAGVEIPTAVDQSARPVTVLDLLHLRDMSGLSISPDGRYAAFQLQRANLATNSYELAWYVTSTSRPNSATNVGDGGKPVWPVGADGIQNGTSAVRPPRWSPNGQWLAYLVRDESGLQIWRSAADGRAQEQITHNRNDVADFIWSEDGSKIYFTVDESRARIEEELLEEGERGYLVDDRYIPYYSSKPVWRPSILSSSNPSVLVVELQTGDERTATNDEALIYEAKTAPKLTSYPYARVVAYSPVTGTVAWTEPTQLKYEEAPYPQMSLYAEQESGSGRTFKCGKPLCKGQIRGVWIVPQASDVYFLRREGVENSSQGLYAWTPETGTVRLILRTDDDLQSCANATSGLVCFHESALTPRRLVSVNLSTGQLTTLVDANPEFQHLEKGVTSKITWKSNEYDEEAFGHLVLPLNYDSDRRYPLVVTTYYSRGFLRGAVGDEYPIQVFSANGFAVLDFDQPSDWTLYATATSSKDIDRALRNDDGMHKRIKSSLDVAIDMLIRRGLVDPHRIAMTGLSLGSELTLYSITRSNRFAAAAISSPSREPLLYYLGGIRKQDRLRSFGYGHPARNAAGRWANHAVSSNIDVIKTPLLLQASDSEYLIALETFAAMREAHKPFEMYVFPDEKHVKMQPRHRYNIYRRNLQWLKFWLQGIEDQDPLDPMQYARWRDMRSQQRASSSTIRAINEN